ncbi:Uncharacterised protein [uncultured archaeon]|nr:Uncharacterised protein [uncultured archaeon]
MSLAKKIFSSFAVLFALVLLAGCISLLGKPDASQKCASSGGVWTVDGDLGSCDCGRSALYNFSTGYCAACPQGEIVYRSPHAPPLNYSGVCYMPTGRDGAPCDRRGDCFGGTCVLVNENAGSGKGVCRDHAIGCLVMIGENGDASPMICID